MSAPRIGVLAVQGAFLEHEQMLRRLGCGAVELRCAEDIGDLDGLVLPGGESTVQRKLLRELGMYGPLRERVQDGLPVLATCAGLILLSEAMEDGETPCFGTLPVVTRRNAYGRQLGSFMVYGPVGELGAFPMIFIRAPKMVRTGPAVETLAVVDGHAVAVRYRNQIALAFHPELSGDDRIHRYFVDCCAGGAVAGNGTDAKIDGETGKICENSP